MKGIKALILLLIFQAATVNTMAGPTEISGFECLQLDTKALGISDQDAWQGSGFPKVFSQPSATSATIGTQMGLVYAKWPLNERDGFIQVLRGNGQLGWLQNKALLALHRADGSVGGCRLAWSADHRVIQSHLDPDVIVRK